MSRELEWPTQGTGRRAGYALRYSHGSIEPAVVSLGQQDNKASSAYPADVENLPDHIPAPHRPVPGPPGVARLVHRRHISRGTDIYQHEKDFMTAKDASEPCSHIQCGLWARHLIKGYEHPSQRHGAIVERSKPFHVLWNEQCHRPCTACHRFCDRPMQPSCHSFTLMRREHDQIGRVRIEIVQHRAHGVRPGIQDFPMLRPIFPTASLGLTSGSRPHRASVARTPGKSLQCISSTSAATCIIRSSALAMSASLRHGQKPPRSPAKSPRDERYGSG